ncbi:hypothetical protein SAMN06265349_101115 [Flavobacterium resistens]|uniref:Uncharacterized protein n=1 Tax=Flavobacterium resistens TaxID=443612 RepID=A0A521AGN8_9FLAO|nr:hypothetical protein [Flavobacterium resistens]MRX69957.1 hypothetical protein [Flavobacterium resistens]SMO33943.1 hypothetical protein SAMN06265349_101115 [Flavobacterium resistens]
MGFFSRLFGLDMPTPTPLTDNSGRRIVKEEKVEQKIPLPGNPFFTNAPEHWPLITDEFLSSNKEFSNNFDEKTGDIILRKRMFMVNSLVLIGKLNEWLSKKTNKKVENDYGGSLLENTDKYATSLCIDKVFEKGIFKTNGIVIDDYKKYAVLLFDRPESIHYINKVKEYFLKEGFEDLIYYAVTDPNTVEENEKEVEFETFSINSFNLDKEKQTLEDSKYKEYELWWNGEQNISFDQSELLPVLKEYHTNCADCYSYILGKFSYALKLSSDDTRIALPEYDELIITGPENVDIIMTLSKKSGINFHFRAIPVFENYRNNFIKTFALLCKDLKQQVVEQNFDRDPFFVDPIWLDELVNVVKNNNEIHSFSLIKEGLFDNRLN